MPATGPIRAAVCTLLAALLALAVLPATGGPAAASPAQPGRATVRLVVADVPGAAPAVTRAAEAAGATRTGQVRACTRSPSRCPPPTRPGCAPGCLPART